jgi:hypothetical protein
MKLFQFISLSLGLGLVTACSTPHQKVTTAEPTITHRTLASEDLTPENQSAILENLKLNPQNAYLKLISFQNSAKFRIEKCKGLSCRPLFSEKNSCFDFSQASVKEQNLFQEGSDDLNAAEDYLFKIFSNRDRNLAKLLKMIRAVSAEPNTQEILIGMIFGRAADPFQTVSAQNQREGIDLEFTSLGADRAPRYWNEFSFFMADHINRSGEEKFIRAFRQVLSPVSILMVMQNRNGNPVRKTFLPNTSCPDSPLNVEPDFPVPEPLLPERPGVLHAKAGYLDAAIDDCKKIAAAFPGIDSWAPADEKVSIVKDIPCGNKTYYIIRGLSGDLVTVRSDNLTQQ